MILSSRKKRTKKAQNPPLNATTRSEIEILSSWLHPPVPLVALVGMSEIHTAIIGNMPKIKRLRLISHQLYDELPKPKQKTEIKDWDAHVPSGDILREEIQGHLWKEVFKDWVIDGVGNDKAELYSCGGWWFLVVVGGCLWLLVVVGGCWWLLVVVDGCAS
eukprot:931238-Amorphochlora_amoeboformis.AAC.1